MKYRIIRYDTWGNEEDGFDVNDQFQVATIDAADYQENETIREYFGASAFIDNGADYGDDRDEIIDETTWKPLGAIVREE